MKKVYIQPLTEVVKLNGGEMLQTISSMTKGDTYSGGTILNKNGEEYDEDLW